MIGVVRGVQLLTTKHRTRDAEGGLFTGGSALERASRMVLRKRRTIGREGLHAVAKNKGMWWAGCIADNR